MEHEENTEIENLKQEL